MTTPDLPESHHDSTQHSAKPAAERYLFSRSPIVRKLVYGAIAVVGAYTLESVGAFHEDNPQEREISEMLIAEAGKYGVEASLKTHCHEEGEGIRLIESLPGVDELSRFDEKSYVSLYSQTIHLVYAVCSFMEEYDVEDAIVRDVGGRQMLTFSNNVYPRTYINKEAITFTPADDISDHFYRYYLSTATALHEMIHSAFDMGDEYCTEELANFMAQRKMSADLARVGLDSERIDYVMVQLQIAADALNDQDRRQCEYSPTELLEKYGE